MLKIKFSVVILFLCVFTMTAQKSINDYKYIIVPIKYDFQKSDDKYQVNSLTKFLFNKAGFQAYLSNEEYPKDLRENGCLALTAKLNNNSSMMTTKMNFDLIDCSNKVVYSSTEAKSKKKEYKTAYHESIRKTFEDIEAQNYSYKQPIDALATSVIIVDEKVKENTEDKEVANVAKVVIPVSATAVIVRNESENKSNEALVEKVDGENVLYAQPNENGFQLVDSTPKVIYILQKTNVKDVYLVKDNSGIVYRVNGIWKLEYYDNGILVSKELNLKFF